MKSVRIQQWALALFLSLATSLTSYAAPPEKHTYIIESGKGWSVCDAYLKQLNGLPPEADFPYCTITKLKAPSVSLPKWVDMEVEANLPLVHRIELNSWNTYDYELEPGNRFKPDPDFARWVAQRKERVNKLHQVPRLRRVRMALIEGGPVETLLSYDGDLNACRNSERRTIREFGQRVGEASSPMKLLLDEKTGRLLGGHGWETATWGEVVMHRDRPYLVLPYAAARSAHPHGAVVYRFEPGGHLIAENRNEGIAGYVIREVCHIRHMHQDIKLPENGMTAPANQTH